MPNRIIKESICSSRNVGALTDFQFRLWVYLITYADDYGRAPADPELIKGHLFARRPGVTAKQIADGIARLESLGMVRIYEVDGDLYLVYPRWATHQRVQAKRSKYPEPPDFEQKPEEVYKYGESRWVTVNHGDLPPESNPIQIESNPIQSGNSQYSNNPRASSAPTEQEVIDYCKSERLRTDARRFYAYYARTGWTTNGEIIQDWRALARKWSETEHRKKPGAAQHDVPPSYDLERAEARMNAGVPEYKKRRR